MTTDRSGITNEQEAQINALLDGELDELATAELKAAASEDTALAQAIVDAWQLQRHLDSLQIEKAPPSLRRKLKRIPSEHKRQTKEKSFGLRPWLLAGGLASVSLVVVMVAMNGPVTGPVNQQNGVAVEATSDEQRAQQTAEELQLAFQYIDKVGLRLGKQINNVLSDEISTPVKDNFSRYMPYTGHSKKEKQV